MNPVLDSINLYFDKIKKIYLSKKTFNKFNNNQLKKIKNLHIIYEGKNEKHTCIRNLFDLEENSEIKVFEHFYGDSNTTLFLNYLQLIILS